MNENITEEILKRRIAVLCLLSLGIVKYTKGDDLMVLFRDIF